MSTSRETVLHLNLKNEIRFEGDGIHTRVLEKSENFSCALICLTAGHEIDTHMSTGTASIQVLEGKGTLILPDRALPLAEGTFVYIPPNVPHSFEATDNLSFLLCLGHLLSNEMYKLRRRVAVAHG